MTLGMSNFPSSFKVDLETATLTVTSRVAYDYWLEKRGGACFPPTNALDPLEIPPFHVLRMKGEQVPADAARRLTPQATAVSSDCSMRSTPP